MKNEHIDRDMGERGNASRDLLRAMATASYMLSQDGLFSAIALLEREIVKVKNKMNVKGKRQGYARIVKPKK